MKSCPYCAKQIPAASTACPYCAELLAPTAVPSYGGTPSPGTRPCPQCGRWIPMQKSSCPNCGGAVLALLRPFSQADGVRWDGDVLIVPKGTSLPPERCLFCGGREHIRAWTREFTWAPEWVWVLVIVGLCTGLIGLIIVVLVIEAVRKKEKLTLPRCEPCRDRQTTAVMAGILGGFGAIVGLPAVFGFLGNVTIGSDGIYFGTLGGAVAGLVLILVIRYRWVRRRTVSCRGITEGAVELRVPNPAFTREALAAMSAPV